MVIKLLLILPLLFSLPEPIVTRTGVDLSAIEIAARGGEDEIRSCVDGGLVMRYRYFVQLCSSSAIWFDDCGDELGLVRRLSVDPVSGTYRVTRDVLEDGADPEVISIQGYTAALDELERPKAILIEQLRRQLAPPAEEEYLLVRVSGECVGDYNRLLSRISSVLTLGMIRLGGFDTGTIRFRLG